MLDKYNRLLGDEPNQQSLQEKHELEEPEKNIGERKKQGSDELLTKTEEQMDVEKVESKLTSNINEKFGMQQTNLQKLESDLSSKIDILIQKKDELYWPSMTRLKIF